MQLETQEKEIRRRLGNRIFAIDNQTHSAVIGQLLRENKLTLSTAESCSGGLLGSAITDEAGSSDYYLGGVVSYSNSAKETLIGVKKESLIEFGAVSKTVAEEMAEGVKRTLGADLALATTGIAGPGGGSEEKPVGLVYIALASPERTEVKKCTFNGSRKSIREMTVETALNMLRLYLLEK
jgi:nicotinamide-nucleotide amidase